LYFDSFWPVVDASYATLAKASLENKLRNGKQTAA